MHVKRYTPTSDVKPYLHAVSVDGANNKWPTFPPVHYSSCDQQRDEAERLEGALAAPKAGDDSWHHRGRRRLLVIALELLLLRVNIANRNRDSSFLMFKSLLVS